MLMIFALTSSSVGGAAPPMYLQDSISKPYQRAVLVGKESVTGGGGLFAVPPQCNARASSAFWGFKKFCTSDPAT